MSERQARRLSPGAVVYFGILAIAAIVFTGFPQIDPAITALFYKPQTGFYLYPNPLIRLVHDGIPPLTVVIAVSLVLAMAWSTWKRQAVCGLTSRRLAYLLMVLAVGPGLMVNTVFKDHWGRARPSQTIEFGGVKVFTPALIPSDQCSRNCSFVSGHAAVGFYPVALAFIVARRRRVLVTAMGLLSGIGVGIVRIIEGGHFLSDVIFSGLVVYGCAWALAHLMLKGQSAADVEGRA